MKIGTIAENQIEQNLLDEGLLPTPLLDTQFAYTLARTVMVGTKLGVFEALAQRALTSNKVAASCETHPGATKKLLNALVGAGYLSANGARYELAPVARRWLLKESPQSLHDKMLFQLMEWDWIEHYEDFVRSGKPLTVHETMSDEKWGGIPTGDALAGGYVGVGSGGTHASTEGST